MTAGELIEKTLGPELGEYAVVKGLTKSKSWWHVRRNETLPDEFTLEVKLTRRQVAKWLKESK